MANGNPEAKKFISIPNAVWSYLDNKPQTIPLSKIEKGMINLLNGYPWKNGKLPKNFNGFRLDLNKDGNKEYFIKFPDWGGTGGPYYLIFGYVNGKWTNLGASQGWFYLLPVKNGWHPIIFCSRGGQLTYTKWLLEYSDGKYREKWFERLEVGKGIKQFIKKTDKSSHVLGETINSAEKTELSK